jgi:opacity protein-like surface antigen
MKKLLLIATAAAAMLLPSASQAQSFDQFMNGYYVGVQGGANYNYLGLGKHTHIYTDTGYLVSGAIGVKTCYDVRLEGEIAYRNNSLDKLKIHYKNFKHSQHLGGHFSSLSFMANAIYDIPVCYCVKPYVGAGIGYARNHISTSLKLEKDKGEIKAKHHKNGFAWQAIAGLAYPLDVLSCYGFDNLDATLEYRYFSPNVKNCWDHSIAVGLKAPL